jgi:hypothetical protein
MRLLFIVILFSVLGCHHPKTNSNPTPDFNAKINQQGKTGCLTPNLIPRSVNDYLTANFAGWTIPDTSDYIKAWWAFYDKNQIPYFVTTDFNDDNLSDYVFLLKNSNSIRLVILTAIGKTFTHWISEDFKETFKKGEKYIQFGLAIEPPGRTDCIVDNKEQSLLLKSNGIALMTMEQKCQIYYWSSGKYQMFRVKSKYSDFLVK